MAFITQWFFMILGLMTTYYAAKLPSFEYHVASIAFLFFLLAFRADMAYLVKVKVKK